MILDEIPVLRDLPDDAQEIVARLLLVAFALAMIWILRLFLTRVIVRPLRNITARDGHTMQDDALDAVIPAMRLVIIAIALLVSARILGVGDSVEVFVTNLGRTFIIVGLLMLVYSLIDLFAHTSNRLFAITGIIVQDRLLPFARTAAKLVILAVGLVIVIQEWGYDVSGLVAGIGLGGLAFSLAAQDTVSNLFGFTALVGDRPFDVGEYIVTPDVEGLVEHVGIRSTRVRRLDQALISVPNSKLANSAILNWSRLTKRRYDAILTVTYDATAEIMKHLLTQIRDMLNARPYAEKDSVVVYFIEFGENGLKILVRCYILLADWGQFTAEREQINLEIMNIVAGLGMSVAFHSQSLYIENMPQFVRGEAQDNARFLSPRERALLNRDEAEPLTEIPPSIDVPAPGQVLGSDEDFPDEK